MPSICLQLLATVTLLRFHFTRASSSTCTIRQIPQTCFEWWDASMPADTGSAINFTDHTIPTSQLDTLWSSLWTSSSPCKEISPDVSLKQTYIFPNLACAGPDLERFDHAVFFNDSGCPTIGVSTAFSIPLRDKGRLVNEKACLDADDLKYNHGKGTQFLSMMLVKTKW